MPTSKPVPLLACTVVLGLTVGLSVRKNRLVSQGPMRGRLTSTAPQAGLPGSKPGPAPAVPENQTVQPGATSESAAGAGSTRTLSHTVKRGESVASLVRHYLAESVFMRRSNLDNAIRQANGLRGNTLQPGETVTIPGIPVQPILDRPVPIPKDFEVRGIYLTGYTAGSAHGLDLIEKWKAVGGNAVVFDVKDYDGEVRVPFEHRYAPSAGITIRNLPKFAHYLHSLHIHAIARIALFRDAYLAQTYPALAVHSRRTGKPWLENGKLAWLDPSNPEVQQYNLDLARLVAGAGVDEIQFDYVRFPAEGDQADAGFAYQKEHPDWPRSKVITDFVAEAHQDLHARGVLVSIDVFGVMAWARPIDLSHTGQDIADLARHCDVMSPMVYPSHFFHMEGYGFPGDAPEHFISESMQRFEQMTRGTGAVLRPWLQAFGWRTKTYSVQYVMTEVRVAKEQGGIGFLFWNARNDYSKPLEAMPKMCAAGDRYFRGDMIGKEETVSKKAGGRSARREARKSNSLLKERLETTANRSPSPADDL
jgi:hypothetical protein